jgi:acetyl-CoA carboxylase biotin carboxyl carrier protein
MSSKDAKEAQQSSRASGSIDASVIRELAELLTETSLTEIEVEQAGLRIRVARQLNAVYGGIPATMPAAPPAPAMAPEAAPAKREAPSAGTVTSPMVGTVYIAPEPGAPAFVKPGDSVKEGDTLLIVEAMKTMNPIAAPRSGVIKEICVRDGEPVEFGQALVVLG